MILFDHIAVAMPRLADAPAVLVGALGGAPAYGAPSGPYRFHQWSFANGGRIEVLEPMGEDGFLHRFLAQRGPGIHHVTFKVPSLDEVCARAESLGYQIVGRDDADPSWAEAFLHPRQALGIVVQLAESKGDGGEAALRWPPPPGPASPPPPVSLIGLRMRARSVDRASRQWGEILQGARATGPAGELVFRWPGSPMRLAIEIDPVADEGPIAIEYAADRAVALADGPHPTVGATFSRLRGSTAEHALT